MIRINLLPVREERRKADLQKQVMLLGLLLVAVVVVIGWVHYSIRSNIGSAQTQVAQIDASIKKFEPQLKQVEAYKAKTIIVNKRSMNAGYAGLDNELFYMDKTMMVFGDAKKVVEDMVKSVE